MAANRAANISNRAVTGSSSPRVLPRRAITDQHSSQESLCTLCAFSPTPLAKHELMNECRLNLGMSENFGFVDLAHLTFPAVMRVDYVRVYQPVDRVNIGCSPPDFVCPHFFRRGSS